MIIATITNLSSRRHRHPQFVDEETEALPASDPGPAFCLLSGLGFIFCVMGPSKRTAFELQGPSEPAFPQLSLDFM